MGTFPAMVLFGFRENKKMGEKSGILERSNSKKKRSGGIKGIFMHADAVDILLMTLGFIGALGDGFTRPVVLLVNSRLMNSIGNTSKISASSPDMQVFIHSIEKVLFFQFISYTTLLLFKFILMKLFFD